MNFDFDSTLISNHLVVIDSSINNYHSLLQGMNPGTHVTLLDASRDGIEQISEILARYSNIESLHIISHGHSGNLQLGTTQLNLETLDQYQDQFSGWAGVLTNEADILIYGCDVAYGDRGSTFIQRFSHLTGADVAASNDLTGASSLGGDWDLEVEVGSIETDALDGQGFQGVLNSLVVANQTNNNISIYDTNGSGGFGSATPLSVGGNAPSTIVVGDINGDGFNDLLTTNEGSSSIGLLLNNGAGGFNAAQTFATGGVPVELALGDVNNDGRLDAIALKNANNSFAVLLNNGAGGFNAQQSFTSGPTPSGIAALDVNNDGNLDIITSNVGNNTVTVQLGNGTGTFTTASSSVTTGTRPLDMTIADVNNDGRLDFITANTSSRNVSIGLGNGTGGFTVTNVAVLGAPNAVTTADINRDGFLDIATSNGSSNTASVLLGNGNGTFRAPTTFAVGANPVDVVLGDLNADGNVDLLTSNANANTISIYTGNGIGGFTAQTPLASGSAPAGLAFANFNRGGTPPGDTIAPVVQSATVSGDILTLTYNETLDGASDPATGAYVVTVNGVQRAVNSVDANATTVTLTLASAVTAGETVILNYAVPVTSPVQDTAGNDAAVLTNQAVTNITVPAADTTAPTLQTAVVSGNTLTLTYNETLDGTSDPASGAYTVTVNGVQRTVNSADANGTTVTLNLATPVAAGETVTLNYAVPSTEPVQDVAGNDAIALIGIAVTNNTLPPSDTTAPVLQSATVNGSTLVLTYSETLDGASDPAAEAYIITVNGIQRAVNSVNANGTAVTLTLANAVTAGQTVTLSYAVPSINPVQDVAGNDAVVLSNQAVNNTTPPTSTVSGVPTLIVANQTGNSISLYTANGSGGFNSPTTMAVAGTGPSTVVLGDINGDGLTDLLTTNETSDNISLFINNGVGGFLAPQSFAAGDQPVEIALGDVNNDGRLDVVVANSNSDTVSVLLGNPNGTLSTQQTFAVGDLPSGVGLADVNGDGNLDILTNNFQSLTVSVNFGTGTGSFGTPTTTFAIGSQAIDMAIADLNNDGRQDFITANRGSRNVSVGLGNGIGGFSVTNFATNGRPNAVTTGDVNGDGFVDIVATNSDTNTVAVLLNNGSGGFRTPTTIGLGNTPQELVLRDINGDNRLDILASTTGNQIAIFTGNGNGTFTAQIPLTTPLAPAGLAFGNAGGTPPNDTTPPTLQSAVVNGSTMTLTYNEALDGASDPIPGAYTITVNGIQRTVNSVEANGTIVTLTLATPVAAGETVTLNYVVPNTNPVQDTAGNDAVALSNQAVTNNTAPTDTTAPVLQSAVVNGSTLTLTYNETLDGSSDPVLGSYTVTVNGVQRTVNSVDVNGTTVSLTLASAVAAGQTVTLSYAVPSINPVQDVAGNDALALNAQTINNTTTSPPPVGGSGSPSLIVANRNSGNISVFTSESNGSFSTQTTYSTNGTQPFAVALGDINRDGLNDVIVANRGSDTLALLINNGADGFLAAQTFAVGDQPVHLILEDINNDTYLDAIVPNNSSGTVSVLLGNASGSFNPQTTVVTAVGPWEVALADLNSDGHLDLVTVHSIAETVTVSLGNGQGEFGAVSNTYTVGSRPEGLVLKDVNNDGRLDFIVSNASSRNVSVGLGNGSGGFATPINYGTGGGNPSPLGVGDVNGDGFADIVVGNTQDDNVAILLNSRNGTFGAPTLFALGDQPFDIILQDVNGDRNLDILSANAGSNSVTVLAGNGAGGFTLLTNLAAGAAPADMVFGNLTAAPINSAPTLVNAIVSGTASNSTLELIYNERLDGNSDPSPNAYTVIVNGMTRTVTGVDVQPGVDAEGTTVILTLSSPIAQGDVVSISYNPGAAPVQDLAGNDAAGFTNRTVTNLRDFALDYSFMRVRDVFDFTQFGYTYDAGYVTGFNNLPSGAANTTGLEVRKNAAEMTQDEIDAYINAVLTLKQTTVLTDNGIEISIYDQFVAAHIATNDAIGRMAPNGTTMANPAHSGPAFMAWHRLLLAEYEEALQAVNPNVTLPYWDWTDLSGTLNVVLQDNFMGPAVSGDVTSGYFSLANGWAMRNDLSDGRWIGVDATPEAFGRAVGVRVQNPGTWETNVTTTLGLQAYTLFANGVERNTGTHNNAHGYIGGVMANVAASPNDPIFWMLHSNVDRLWAEWQVNNHWGTSFYATGTQNYGHNLDDPLFLWDNGAVPIAADLRDILPKGINGSTGSIVNGNITISGNLTNTGVVTPGNSPGTVVVQGNYVQTNEGELTIEVAGLERGTEYDFLKVEGTASLDGALNLYFLGDFLPTNQKFEFLVADNIQGDFSDINIFGLETPVEYQLYKSVNNTSYVIEFFNLSDTATTNYGVAQTFTSLYEDTDLSLYNPFFGQGLDMYIYGTGHHHGWGYDGEAAIVDHTSHSGSSTNWYLPYTVDVNYWIDALNRGEAIPEELMSPMHSDDIGDGGTGHEGHHGSECDESSHCDCHQEHSCGSGIGHDDHDGEHSHDHSDHGTGHIGSDADHGDHDHGTCDDHDSHDDHSSHDDQTHMHGGTNDSHSEGSIIDPGSHGSHSDIEEDSHDCQYEEESGYGKPKQPVTNHDDHNGEHSADHSNHGTGVAGEFAIARPHHNGNHITHFPNQNGTVDEPSLHKPIHAASEQAVQMTMPSYAHSNEPHSESNPDRQTKKDSKSSKPKKITQEKAAASDQGSSNRHTGFHLTDQDSKRYSTISMMDCN